MPDVDDIEPEGENAVRYLTPRERDCLALVNAHLTSKEIAAKLNLSPFTVNQHIASAMKRLQVAGRRQAAEMYAEYLRETQAKVPFDQRFGGWSAPLEVIHPLCWSEDHLDGWNDGKEAPQARRDRRQAAAG